MNIRIKEVRSAIGKNQTDFAKDLSVSRSAICKIESGENTPSEQTIKLICNIFNVNEDWLRYGIGEMFKPQTKNQEIIAFANNIMHLDDESFKKRFIEALTKLDERDWETLEKIANNLIKEG